MLSLDLCLVAGLVLISGHFSGPIRAFTLVCVCRDNRTWTKGAWPRYSVYFDPVCTVFQEWQSFDLLRVWQQPILKNSL